MDGSLDADGSLDCRWQLGLPMSAWTAVGSLEGCLGEGGNSFGFIEFLFGGRCSINVDVLPTQNESANEADDFQLGEQGEEELCHVSPRHDVDDEELEAAQGEDIDVDGSCAALEDMLTASSCSVIEKPDEGFRSGSDDDVARF